MDSNTQGSSKEVSQVLALWHSDNAGRNLASPPPDSDGSTGEGEPALARSESDLWKHFNSPPSQRSRNENVVLEQMVATGPSPGGGSERGRKARSRAAEVKHASIRETIKALADDAEGQRKLSPALFLTTTSVRHL